jgi:hypothetical protein
MLVAIIFAAVFIYVTTKCLLRIESRLQRSAVQWVPQIVTRH